ncbi:MAG: hypothetical protein GY811_00315 [Myxococcales bacterium]|nr:hypothetical protein [Myxococcales bacterium]
MAKKQHFGAIASLVASARQRRCLALCTVNLRLLIGFAFLPAGLKKVLGQPFTDADKVGVFHEFLHAFLATGPFYQFVGVLQLTAACLLMTQRFAFLGAVIMMPVLVAISALCWGTGVGTPTLITVTLMGLGTLGLLMWDLDKWRGIFVPEGSGSSVVIAPGPQLVDSKLWARCGWAVLATYAIASILHGGVYRPRGMELDTPAFYLLPLIAVYPVVTWFIDRSLFRRRASETLTSSSNS